MPERFESQFQRVVGGSPEEKREGLQKYEGLLNDPSDDIEKKYKHLELQKSEKDLALIAETEKAVDEMVRQWGGDPRSIPPEKVHIVQENTVPVISQEKFQGGFHNVGMQFVVVEQRKSEIRF